MIPTEDGKHEYYKYTVQRPVFDHLNGHFTNELWQTTFVNKRDTRFWQPVFSGEIQDFYQ